MTWKLPQSGLRRETVLLALVSIVGAGGGALLLSVPGGGSSLRLAVAAHVIFVWPGWALLTAVRPYPTLAPLPRVAIALSASAIPLALEALAAYVLRPTMTAFLWWHVALSSLLSIAAAVRVARLRDEDDAAASSTRGDWAAAFAALAFAVVLWWVAPAYGPDLREGIDSWYHLGYMSYLAEGARVSPSCAFFAGGPPDPRYPYSASHLSLAAFAAAARVPILKAWAFLAPAFSVAILLAAYLFVRRVFNHPSLAAAAMLLLMAGMLMPEKELIRLLSFKLSASPAVALRYPYPFTMATRVLLPTLLALMATYLQQPRRWVLVLIGGLAFAAPAFHVSQVLYLPLISAALVLAAAVAHPQSLRPALKIAATLVLAVVPLALLAASTHAVNQAFAGLAADDALMHRLRGDRLYLVAPASMLFPWMLGAIALAAVGLLDSRARPASLVAGAIVLLIPLVNLNPILAPPLSQRATLAILNRLYYPPPSPLYFCGILLVIAALGGRLLERTHPTPGRQASSVRRLAGLAAGGAVLTLAALAGVTLLARSLSSSLSHSDFPLWPALTVAAITLLLFPFARWSRPRTWHLLPARWEGQAGLLLIAGGVCVLLGAHALAGAPAVTIRLRNDLTRWPTNPSSGAPRFLEAVAADAPAFSTTVYATDPFAAELTPAFARQHVLFYDLNANPAVDTPALASDWATLANPAVPLEQRQALLRRHGIGYVILTRAEPDRAAAVTALAARATPIYRDEDAVVWRISRDGLASGQ